MAFSQSTILDGPTATRNGSDLLISWSSSDTPTATTPVFQLYVDRRLAWHGLANRCHILVPNDGADHEVHVGTCLASEAGLDLSAYLPAPTGGTGSRAMLTWLGGTFLDDRIAGFNVYRGATAGAAAPTSGVPEVKVAAYPQGQIRDGFGLGGFGQGGFGRSASSYQYTSDPLPTGVNNFNIVAFDDAGNLGSPQGVSVTIFGPPPPPAARSDGTRIGVSLNVATHRATLSWTPG